MDYLFDHPRPVPAALSPVSDSADDGAVLLSQGLWDALNLAGAQEGRAAVSISRVAPRPTASAGKASPIASLVAWARLDANQDSGVVVPKQWLQQYRAFVQGDISSQSKEATHHLIAVQPVVLSEIILTAHSHDAYTLALAHRAAFEAHFFDTQRTLRQDEVYTLHARDLDISGGDGDGFPSSGHHYRLVMAGPVLQGYAKRGVTRFYVTLAPEPAPTSNGHSAHTLDDLQEIPSDEDEFQESEDGFEINEAFLAGSVLHSMPANGTPPDEADALDGPPDSSIDRARIHSAGYTRVAEQLASPRSSVEDDCTVYISTADLSHVGVLSGDWAVVRSSKGSSSRLARVCAEDSDADSSGPVRLSPQLLHNITSGTAPTSHEVCLRPSPFGSQKPSIPTARSVTIARVASPISTDRAYQPLFLRALQDYFKDTTRLVKQGDIITVKINTDEVLWQTDVDPKDEALSGENEAALEYKFMNAADAADELAFFTVTNIEHHVVSSNGDASMPASDVYLGSAVGELGCWVDPSVTRMIQTGVEHARVPDMARYLNIQGSVPFAPVETEASNLLGPNSAYSKLLALTAAALKPHAVEYQLQLTVLLKGPKGSGKFTTASWVVQHLGIHLFEVNCYEVLGENDAKTEGTLRARFERAASCSPCILLLRNIDAFAQTTQGLEPGKEPSIANALQECISSLQQGWNLTGYPVLVVGTTSDPDKVPSRVLSSFKHEITLEAPGEAERHEILNSLLRSHIVAPDVSVKDVAVQTAALVAADLVNLVSRAQAAAAERAAKDTSASGADLFYAGIPLTAADFDASLKESRAAYSENIGAPKIPSVTWDDVGGLAHVKADILDTIQLPLEHPEFFADGLKKRSGILLYGPPGTGKTLLAKAVATSCALNFFSVKGPELLNMYIGESEANVRRVFQRARDARPCVIFFDELDSVAPKRGSHGDSGGVMDRIVSQILAELDGLSGGKAGADVFVIGATNRPDLLDPALLRPGRFDRMLYLGVSNTHAAQLNILQALTRKFRLHPELRLEDIAEQCPFHYTGADFYALCADALLKAMSRKAEELEATIAELNSQPPDPRHPYPLTPQYYLAELATPAEMEVLVMQQDFTAALKELVPSVSQAEMEHYAQVQQRFSKETINAAA
ncbi:AAA-domain-containing protein [Rhodofomes roseus]|uniref:Peroxisomal ATPase PEX6 n=1 Tax=Rhodofomes roseus TaxID=34475 RepID=A0ABQ8K327_9APHY|nr:AAA-domain-containing protein [Rhodofomes roseus]KAH9830946.1 AAA-domain-containing protein [Rhodofomes roseus]